MNQDKTRKTLRPLILVVAILAFFLLAAGLQTLRFKPGEPFNLAGWLLAQLVPENLQDDYEDLGPEFPAADFWSTLSPGLRKMIIVVFWLVLIFSIIYTIISPRFRRDLVRMFMFVITLTILLPIIANRIAQQQMQDAGDEMSGQLPFGDFQIPEPPPFVQQPPGWFLIFVEGLLLVLLMLGIYWLWSRFRPMPDAQAVVVKNVRLALSDLDSGSELEDVVIACYAKMCRELQKARLIRRHQAMTPREFENHLIKAGISSVHVRQLTSLFESVRYGAKPTDSIMADNARNCLQAITRAYGG